MIPAQRFVDEGEPRKFTVELRKSVDVHAKIIFCEIILLISQKLQHLSK